MCTLVKGSKAQRFKNCGLTIGTSSKKTFSCAGLNKLLNHQFEHSTSVSTSSLPSLSPFPSLYFYQGHHPWCCYHGDKPRRAVGETCEVIWLNACVFSRMCVQLFAPVCFFVRTFIMLCSFLYMY